MYEVKRALPTEKNKEKVKLMKNDLGEKIMKQFVALISNL